MTQKKRMISIGELRDNPADTIEEYRRVETPAVSPAVVSAVVSGGGGGGVYNAGLHTFMISFPTTTTSGSANCTEYVRTPNVQA